MLTVTTLSSVTSIGNLLKRKGDICYVKIFFLSNATIETYNLLKKDALLTEYLCLIFIKVNHFERK